MARASAPHPDQLPLDLTADDALERLIEARVAARCEAESFVWRFRLIVLETIMMGALVAVAGVMLGQPGMLVARAAVLVAGTCFATGMILLGLSAWSARLLTRFKRWRAA